MACIVAIGECLLVTYYISVLYRVVSVHIRLVIRVRDKIIMAARACGLAGVGASQALINSGVIVAVL